MPNRSLQLLAVAAMLFFLNGCAGLDVPALPIFGPAANPFWALIAIFAVGFMVWRFRNLKLSKSSSATSAEEIVKVRYARGELSIEQYREMLSELTKAESIAKPVNQNFKSIHGE